MKVDLKELSLNDIIDKLQEEQHFSQKKEFSLIDIIDNNHIVFSVPRQRIIPKQIHALHYLKDGHEIIITSHYNNLFLPILFAALPICSMIFGWNDLTMKAWTTSLLPLFGVSLFIGILCVISLNEGSKYVQ